MANEHDPSIKRSSGSGPRPVPKGAPIAASFRYGTGDCIAGKYRLGKRLGEGGMGEVWLAHNETLDIDVAIKLIRSDSGSLPEQTDRLLNEARAAARLGHPAICRVNDFGKTDGGDPFIVMELLEGEDLADALARRGRLSATKAVRTILPIANALTVAHTKGIVHRDLKPENIFLAQNEEGHIQPKLVDFGVAKLEATHSMRLTQTGALLGSPLYMSPEQARGDDVDHRADIWALGVVLYEMMTGRPPFEGKNYNAVLYSITANPTTPITDLGVADDDLWTILDRALQKDPDRRWYSMRDFGEALATWLGDRGVHEDITGASLQTTWLNWQREENDLGSAPPPADRSAAKGIEIPPPPTLPSRPREITVKRPRAKQSARLVAAVVLTGIAVISFAIVLWPSEEVVVEAPPREAPPALAEPKPLAPEEAPPLLAAGGGIAPAFAASNKTPALDPSALPFATDEPPKASVSAKRAPAPPPPKAKAQSSARGGITTKDPYGAATASNKPALKDPFK